MHRKVHSRRLPAIEELPNSDQRSHQAMDAHGGASEIRQGRHDKCTDHVCSSALLHPHWHPHGMQQHGQTRSLQCPRRHCRSVRHNPRRSALGGHPAESTNRVCPVSARTIAGDTHRRGCPRNPRGPMGLPINRTLEVMRQTGIHQITSSKRSDLARERSRSRRDHRWINHGVRPL